jgi:glycine hydroxymethyltransferase
MVPFDDQSPFVTSGMRIGTPAITTRGLKEKDCEQIVEWVDDVIVNYENDSKINMVKKEVNKFMEDFPLFPKV